MKLPNIKQWHQAKLKKSPTYFYFVEGIKSSLQIWTAVTVFCTIVIFIPSLVIISFIEFGFMGGMFTLFTATAAYCFIYAYGVASGWWNRAEHHDYWRR
jgi:hypothetical protein